MILSKSRHVIQKIENILLRFFCGAVLTPGRQRLAWDQYWIAMTQEHQENQMEWNRSAALSLARLSCTTCSGEGIKKEKRGRIIPCSCVLRAVFRACYARFRVCVGKEKYMSRVSFEHFGGKERRMMWARKDEEYAADFHLISRRVLDPFHYRVFSCHFLLGGDWKLCCRQLNMDRGQFFHAVYRVQEILGQVFYELEPYGLYPPRDYFVTRITGPRPPRLDISSCGSLEGEFGNPGSREGESREAASGRSGRALRGNRKTPVSLRDDRLLAVTGAAGRAPV